MLPFSACCWPVALADTLRWWSVPGAFLGLILLLPVCYKLGRHWLAAYFESRDAHLAAMFIALPGSEADTIMPPGPRFWAIFGAVLFLTASMIAGLIIPLPRTEILEHPFFSDYILAMSSWADPHSVWELLMALAWILWGTGCWIVAIAFSRNKRSMVAASVLCWWASVVSTQAFVNPVYV